jgi:hypothetical protein
MNTSDRMDGVLSATIFRFLPDFEPILRQTFLGGIITLD